MIYYIILYFIRRYAINRLIVIFLITFIVTLIWYFFFYTDKYTISIYKWTYIKWCFYFLNMLLGAAVGLYESKHGYLINKPHSRYNKTWINITLMIICMSLFYGLQIMGKKIQHGLIGKSLPLYRYLALIGSFILYVVELGLKKFSNVLKFHG